MDAKDLRTESAVSERNNDGSKYSQSGGIALHCDRNKSYQDMGSNSLGKVDVPNSRPCAVIGPDRVVPPPAASDAYHIKKGPVEPWQCMDNAYRRPPEYPHKITNFQNPTRNISPRQTFQENMQRIMVPPTYNSIKINDDTNYAQVSDRSNGLSKNIKLNMPPEAKFCDVPYAVNPTNNEQKNVRNPDMCIPSANPALTRTAPHGWPPGSVNLRSTRMYGAPELYQYQEYPSCAGPRPVLPRPHRTVPEEQGYVYADPYYQEGNIRFKPYPSVKERFPQQRYEYIGNYSNPFHPPPGFAPHKYELPKSSAPHPYPPYPPIKYLDSRAADPVMEGYQRNSQGNYNIQYRNQIIHPNYGPVISNCPQNKMHSYPPDAHIKTPNKLPYDNNAKAYIEYENNRPKIYPPPESYFVNEMTRMPMKSQVIMPNYPTLNMHNLPPNHQYYKKDNQQMKNYEHMAHFRTMDPNLVHNPMSRHAPVFSPNTLAISPTDSNTSNDTAHTLGTSQEDCGYVSQSSSASVRSMDSGINRIPNDYLRKYYDNRYGPIVRTSPMMSKSQLNLNTNISKDKKQIDVRQFLQMWNEGDEEAEDNGSKEIIIQTGSSDIKAFGKTHEAMNSQEQLYVLGLVNVPSEELAKYEHIQKVSKLPENIKGYNSIELLNQFEEVIESSNMNNYKSPNPKDFQISMKGGIPKPVTGVIPPRPVSPLDVEAKISQSVIHKEVGCNFEIKPCSPKMLNVEVAAPAQNILAERSIEKVTNPVMIKSPLINRMDENIDCNLMKRQEHRLHITENARIPSCKMINTQFSSGNPIDSIKSSYSLQDLESNSGLCLASLPRLDNDIELNFPEVNQQFINANKGDSSVLTTSLRDLPTLEVLDQSVNQVNDKFERLNPPGPDNDSNKPAYLVDSEKEITKLSKYRKTKNNSIELKENHTQQNINAIRTDSVIIKNPENIKKYGDNSDTLSETCSNEIAHVPQQTPMNLTSQDNAESNADKEIQLPVEIAIDFSLNKSGVLDNTDCPETNIESQIETPKLAEENSLHTLISQDNSSDSGRILSDFSNQEKETLMDMDNIDENCTSFGHEINSECALETVNEVKIPNESIVKENTPSADRFTEVDFGINECAPNVNSEDIITDASRELLTEPIPKEMTPSDKCINNVDFELNECAQNDNSVEMITDVNSQLLPDTNTGTPNNEFSNNIKGDDSLNEMNTCEDLTTGEFPETINCNFTDPKLKLSQILTNDQNEVEVKEVTAKKFTNFESIEEVCDNENIGKKSPKNTETEADMIASEVSSNDITDSVSLENIQPQNIDCNTLLLTNEEVLPENCERLDSTQSQIILGSESHSFTKDLTTGNLDAKFESTQLLSQEHVDHERELKEINTTYEDDTVINNPAMSGDESREINTTENIKQEFTIPVKRYLGYGSKELYSPWIQKLLMFTEGYSSHLLTKINCDGETVHETIMNETVDCSPDTTKTVHLHEKLAAEDLKQNDATETAEDIKNISTSKTISLDLNTINTVDDLFGDNDNLMTKSNVIIDEENSPTVELNHNNTVAVNPVDTDVPNETSMIISALETEPNDIYNINNNLETQPGSPVVNDFHNIEKRCEPDTSSCLEDNSSELFQMHEKPEDKNIPPDCSGPFDNLRHSYNRIQENVGLYKKSRTLKRSLSDSALNMYNDERPKQDNEENVQFVWPFKRRKVNNVDNDLLAQNLCNIIHNNRRNSISSFYNEENVSFCILIDNSCIITEEESEEPELSADCSGEIQNDCIKSDENNTLPEEVAFSPHQENPCDYSDSFVMDCSEEKPLEESWVEDVACVETVISDDIAEDIEICESSSPKGDDILSDNDESGVFSSSEHTDKVRYIYGDKMCNDDAQFVETLYNTPQMDVNKTLYSRETHVSEEYDRYYDNDSLEKMLSASNEPELLPYGPDYNLESMFRAEVISSKNTPEDKENMNIETFPPFQSKGNALDIVVDMNVDKLEPENMHAIDFFAKARDDTVHSCESSVDGALTYNEKDEETIYTSSSSPEVSSTTSEEKNSGILLKITNYKGSRISQINDISRVNKQSRCKFTEDKDYLQSHSNFAKNRPLLTKGAQKYIPPLKESIRDLKVKLSLPQHSLMKLKQLKISKDEPKVNNQNPAVSRIHKKPKPKFEDVLKSIDEIQFKMHKEKTKKSKKSIPKVVIKKNQNGSHYASTSNKDDFNPDLTGRKWQPWVFIEKNHFIDKMAIKKKTKAIYSHRKRTYVLAEKFQKYKSASSAKFVISPPISDNPSVGLKYTIRLKHNY